MENKIPDGHDVVLVGEVAIWPVTNEMDGDGVALGSFVSSASAWIEGKAYVEPSEIKVETLFKGQPSPSSSSFYSQPLMGTYYYLINKEGKWSFKSKNLSRIIRVFRLFFDWL